MYDLNFQTIPMVVQKTSSDLLHFIIHSFYAVNNIHTLCVFQTSPESPGIFMLLQKMFRSQPVSELVRMATEQLGLTAEEVEVMTCFLFLLSSCFVALLYISI
jgi:hypothetical protein